MVWIIVVLACIPQLLHGLLLKNITLKSLTYNLYTPAEFYLFYFIFKWHVHDKAGKIWLTTSMIIYSAVSVYYILFSSLTEEFIPFWTAINNIFYTSWILIIFYEQYAFNDEHSLSFRNAFLWFVMGLLLYAPCTAMIFAGWDFMEHSNMHIMKIIHSIFNIIMYICFSIGFYVDRKEYVHAKQ